jgi:uncharacterized YccA/Bax inhibitor family protein
VDEQIAYNLVMAQLMRTSNPALKGDSFRTQAGAFGADAMTVSGTVNKTGILSICVIATAAWTWNRFLNSPSPETVLPSIMIGAIGGFVLALVTIFKKEWSPVTAPAYALLEGLVLGGVSAMFELRFPGIAMQAVGLTFGTLIALLLAYRSGLIRVSDQLRLGVVAATGGIALFYLITFVLGFFGVRFNSVYGSGPIGIGDRRCLESGPRLRPDREWRSRRCTEIHGMVWRIRSDGHPDLALPRDHSLAVQAP